MTFREIRDHKFKILFTYYFHQTNLDEIILNYFNNIPYEEDEEDKNDYVGDLHKSHQNIHKIKIDNDTIEHNASDPEISISIGETENINDIKNKVHDIVNHTLEIDEIISKCLKDWDITRVGKAELTIIRLAIYEMYFDNSIDLEVAINEAVELAKVYADDKADKFVNGVLATIYKEKA